MKNSQITEWTHEIWRSQVPEGGHYIDATMGKGNDTLFLCDLAGEKGHVLAFDVQEEAVELTRKRLEDHQVSDRVQLILNGHEHMAAYAEPESVDLICFNFGYLPGGDHEIATRAETSLAAIRAGLHLLKRGGMMSLVIYSGGDTGFEEREQILAFLKTLSPREYTVILNEYYNRENDPPLPVFIFC